MVLSHLWKWQLKHWENRWNPEFCQHFLPKADCCMTYLLFYIISFKLDGHYKKARQAMCSLFAEQRFRGGRKHFSISFGGHHMCEEKETRMLPLKRGINPQHLPFSFSFFSLLSSVTGQRPRLEHVRWVLLRLRPSQGQPGHENNSKPYQHGRYILNVAPGPIWYVPDEMRTVTDIVQHCNKRRSLTAPRPADTRGFQ